MSCTVFLANETGVYSSIFSKLYNIFGDLKSDCKNTIVQPIA